MDGVPTPAASASLGRSDTRRHHARGPDPAQRRDHRAGRLHRIRNPGAVPGLLHHLGPGGCLHCIAAPIFGPDRRVVATLCFVVPVDMYPDRPGDRQESPTYMHAWYMIIRPTVKTL